MLRDPIDHDQIDILPEGSDLDFYVGKICGKFFSLIENIRFYFPFPPIPQFRCLCPFVVIKKFPVGFQTDHVILLQMVEDEKCLIVIITAVHNKGGVSEKSSCLFDRIKSDGVYRFIVLLSRRMDHEKNTDGMLAGSQGTGLCYMVTFFINTSRLCAFRTIANDTKSFKLFSIWFYDITFINEDYWIGWYESFYSVEIRCGRRGRSTF